MTKVNDALAFLIACIRSRLLFVLQQSKTPGFRHVLNAPQELIRVVILCGLLLFCTNVVPDSRNGGKGRFWMAHRCLYAFCFIVCRLAMLVDVVIANNVFEACVTLCSSRTTVCCGPSSVANGKKLEKDCGSEGTVNDLVRLLVPPRLKKISMSRHKLWKRCFFTSVRFGSSTVTVTRLAPECNQQRRERKLCL